MGIGTQEAFDLLQQLCEMQLKSCQGQPKRMHCSSGQDHGRDNPATTQTHTVISVYGRNWNEVEDHEMTLLCFQYDQWPFFRFPPELGGYHARTLVYRLILVLVPKNWPDWNDLRLVMKILKSTQYQDQLVCSKVDTKPTLVYFLDLKKSLPDCWIAK